MQYAISLYYGGEFIDALQASHSTYEKHLTVCPICKSAVFWQAPSTRSEHKRKIGDRIIEVKAVEKIGAHFKHFLGAAPDCELKSSKISIQDREKIDAKSKNQRIRVFTNNLYRLFKTNLRLQTIDNNLSYLERIFIIKFNNHRGSNIFNEFKKQFVSIFILELKSKTFDSYLDYLKELDFLNNIDLDIYSDSVKEFFAKFLSTYDQEKHFKICKEVISILQTPKQSGVLGNLLMSSFFTIATKRVFVKNKKIQTFETTFNPIEDFEASFIEELDDIILSCAKDVPNSEKNKEFLQAVFGDFTQTLCTTDWFLGLQELQNA